MSKPYEDVKSNTEYEHELRDKTIVNFIYNFFFICYSCFVSFINSTFFAQKIKSEIGDNVLFYFSDCFK